MSEPIEIRDCRVTESWQSRAERAEDELSRISPSGWQPIETAPETGVFLVYLVEAKQGSRIHAANWLPDVKTVGCYFAWDMPEATHWMPLPAPPA